MSEEATRDHGEVTEVQARLRFSSTSTQMAEEIEGAGIVWTLGEGLLLVMHRLGFPLQWSTL